MSYNRYGSNFLKGVRDFRVAPKLEAQVIGEYLASLDCPRSLAVWLMFSNGEHEQLANLEFDPLHYSSVSDVSGAYMATKFLSKFTGLKTSYNVRDVALQKFHKMENLCRQTNRRFRFLSSDPLYKGPVVWLHHAIIRKVERILGDFSSDEMFSLPDWGPGASTTIPRRRASSQEKFQCETGITRDLHSLLFPEAFEMNYPLWTRHLAETGTFPNFQVGNKVITVAKDATTDRVIAIEPGINLWFQKAQGLMIKRRLLRVGIDLRYQSRNQELARVGSLDRSHTTVDLSSASDTIAHSVVEELLPPLWYEQLDASRSKYGQLDRPLRWEKFSSMGNGFTFQLQTLIFFAVAKCCAEYLNADGEISVYGDDIVLPTRVFPLFSEMIEFYGFLINRKKSHSDSYFRESCGAHYYLGRDVKPVFFKERIASLVAVFRAANKIRRLAWRQGFHLGCDARFRSVFDHLVQQVPAALRLKIPESLGDGGFISNFDEATPVRCDTKHPQYEGYYVHSVREASIACQDERNGYLLAELWRLSRRDLREEVSNGPSVLEAIRRIVELDREDKGRNSVPLHETRLRMSRSTVVQWVDMGPWITLET